MKISVIITILNEAKTIEALLLALVHQTKKPDEIIIVDGGSTDTTLAVIEQMSTRLTLTEKKIIKVFQKKGNRSLGRNYAIDKARHEVIAITDAGCIPHKDWLAELAKKANEVADKGKQAYVIAGYYDAKTTTPFEEAVVPYFLVMSDRVNPHSFLPATRSMMLDRAIWQAIGQFNEKLSDNEDYEFAQRIKSYEAKTKKNVLYFTGEAKVTWLPPHTLTQFTKTIFRFARGDAQSKLWRPKVGLLFGRYAVALMIGVIAFQWWTLLSILITLLVGLTVYSLWAIKKNIRYVPHGWHWLPVLQIVSDWAVMVGSMVGFIRNLQPRNMSV